MKFITVLFAGLFTCVAFAADAPKAEVAKPTNTTVPAKKEEKKTVAPAKTKSEVKATEKPEATKK